MKKIVTFVFGVLLATQVWADTYFDYQNLHYKIVSTTDYTVEVASSEGYTNLTSVVIPTTVPYNGNNYTVIGIGYQAFKDCTGLTSITIPNSVTSIGEYAFSACLGLTSVTIPNSVTSISDGTFFVCSGLTSVTIPNSVTSIGKNAFHMCIGLTSVTIPNSVTSIGDNAFSQCYNLTSVTIPNSVTTIGEDAFYNVKFIYYSGSATSENNWGALILNGTIDGDFIYADEAKTQLFAYSGNGGEVTIPNSVTSIGERAFWKCSGLTSINIPNSVTSIGSKAFWYCSNLTSINIPNSVTSIGDGAFCDCRGLKSLTIPNSVTSIGDGAFGGVKNIDYSGSASYDSCSGSYSSHWGALTLNGIIDGDFIYADMAKTYLTAYIGNGGEVTIPNSVTDIGIEAFYECESITSVIIPNSVIYIGPSAFDGCCGLTSISIPNSVTSIDYAFNDCNSLQYYEYDNALYLGNNENPYLLLMKAKSKDITSCEINSNCKFIYEGAFGMCTGLTSVVIPNSVTSIGDRAFRNCSGLTSITISNSLTSIQNSVFSGCSGLTSVNIPNSVTEIHNYAFRDCSGLTSVTIPNSVTHIAPDAFQGCNGLTTSVTIPNSVTNIDNNMFDGWYNLTSVSIPNSVTSIGNSAFNDCTSLSTIDIPSSVTSIGNSAFNGCTSLSTIAIPSSVTQIGDSAFAFCSNLETVQIGEMDSEENSQKPKTIVTMAGDDDIVVGTYAFYGCEGLKSVFISSNVSVIGNSAFAGCKNLTIYCEATSQPAGWAEHWNPDNCNVVWGYKIAVENGTVVTETTANAANIYTQGNIIVVENANEEIHVYDAMGRLVCRDAARHVSTEKRTELRTNTAGIFIVKVGNEVKRVMVNE